MIKNNSTLIFHNEKLVQGEIENKPVHERPISKHIIDKITFYKIYLDDDEEGSNGLFLSLLTRGIFNFAEIIRIENNYYSKEYDLFSLEVNDDNDFVYHMEAERFIMESLFTEGDHCREKKPSHVKNSTYAHHNLHINKNGHYYFFDFSFVFSGRFPYLIQTKEYFYKSIMDMLDGTTTYVEEGNNFSMEKDYHHYQPMFEDPQKFIKIINDKFDQLIEVVSDAFFLQEVIKKSGLDLSKNPFFYKEEKYNEKIRKYQKNTLSIIKEIRKFFQIYTFSLYMRDSVKKEFSKCSNGRGGFWPQGIEQHLPRAKNHLKEILRISEREWIKWKTDWNDISDEVHFNIMRYVEFFLYGSKKMGGFENFESWFLEPNENIHSFISPKENLLKTSKNYSFPEVVNLLLDIK